ncbi:serine/threonine-protein kinase H1 isoform X2 [Caretta caretta]|uniref:serine/threonine-protein kinase H1 isoform X2 n=1 Tax=Caretta caretta TaxID=8467 RepID=UPI00209545B5|nr:serine/threonine-protein kinase H1 isoform X2 [Caretta caretta]
MGCGTSKVLPEPPTDVQLDLVKKVEPYTGHKNDVYKHFIKDDGGAAIKAGSPSPPCHTNPYSGGHPPNYMEQPEPRKNKVAKYRAKFDPRVTAKYDIKALIGRGSFSRVVRVEHKASKQPYAIKMIETKYREGREVCESELCVLRRVRHTNIIQLIEVFETQERVYMVMELATGGELFDRIIAKGSFTERDATRVLQMVLDGVKYLHTLGITHRDLKPENLLYYHPGTDSKIMITDFGLASARKKGDDCLMKTTCGTPEYIAPEILVRKPYTNSVDMWALGVISYILLSGTMPFEDDNRTRLYRQILKGKYSYSGEVSSSAQVTMQSQNRQRAPAWTEREVLDLIAVWGEESVLSKLRSKRQNAKTFQKISEAMRDRGYGRDATQCFMKLKETKESNGHSWTEPQTCRFYAELHAVLGGAATTTPPLSVDSNDGVLSAMPEDLWMRRRTSLRRAHSTPFSPTVRIFLSSWLKYPPAQTSRRRDLCCKCFKPPSSVPKAISDKAAKKKCTRDEMFSELMQ